MVRQPAPSNEPEARSVLNEHVAALRRRSYEDLRRIIGDVKRSSFGGRVKLVDHAGGEMSEVMGPSGALYHLHTDVWWDAAEGGDLRVIVELQEHDKPYGELHGDFIMAPDGTLVGEERE